MKVYTNGQTATLYEQQKYSCILICQGVRHPLKIYAKYLTNTLKYALKKYLDIKAQKSNSHGLVVKSQGYHAEGPGLAHRILQGMLFPVAAHHTTLAFFMCHLGAGRPLVKWLEMSSIGFHPEQLTYHTAMISSRRKFEIHSCETKECSRGEAKPLASPPY